MKKVKLFEDFVGERLSMDAVYIHQITGSGQDAAQNFIDDNNIDSAKLVAFLKQHKDSKEKYDVRDMINGTNKNKRFMKQFLKESVNEEYGGPGNYSVPEDHLAGIRVPKGGSCCANCEYWIAKEEICTNTHYQEWAGTNKIPYPADEYCTDWYEPAPQYNLDEATTSWSKMMKGVKSGESGPWTIVAIENNKVVGQKNISIRDLLPAAFEEMRKEFPRAKFHIEDSTGGVVWNI